MHLYIFGSYTRGEFDKSSDVDFLMIKDNDSINTEDDLNKFSIYEIKRLKDLWLEGNPFAWHLYKESKLVFSSDGKDILQSLGVPNKYKNLKSDLDKFLMLYKKSVFSLLNAKDSKIFDLGMIFLAIRNFSTCYCLGHLDKINFSRDSALKLDENSIEISESNYELLKRARILSTRGYGENITSFEIDELILELPIIEAWFDNLNNFVK